MVLWFSTITCSKCVLRYPRDFPQDASEVADEMGTLFPSSPPHSHRAAPFSSVLENEFLCKTEKRKHFFYLKKNGFNQWLVLRA